MLAPQVSKILVYTAMSNSCHIFHAHLVDDIRPVVGPHVVVRLLLQDSRHTAGGLGHTQQTDLLGGGGSLKMVHDYINTKHKHIT